MKMKTKKKGFTLIELLVCLFIIGLMMLLIIPNIAQQRKTAQDKSDEAIVRVVKSQQQAYMIDLKTRILFQQWMNCLTKSILIKNNWMLTIKLQKI